MKLGKHAPKIDPRTLRFSTYLKVAELPPLLSQSDWTVKQRGPHGWPLQMFGNDRVGDCVLAAKAKIVQTVTGYAQGAAAAISTDDVLAAYSAITGYDSKDPSTDRGTNMLDAAKYMQKVGIAGHRIDAYMSVDPKNWDHLRAGIMLFSHFDFGFALPAAVDPERNPTLRIWDIPPTGSPVGEWEPGSLGGHDVAGNVYDGIALIDGSESVVVDSWANYFTVTRRFIETYADEGFVYLLPEFFKDGKAPSGFDLAALTNDLDALA